MLRFGHRTAAGLVGQQQRYQGREPQDDRQRHGHPVELDALVRRRHGRDRSRVHTSAVLVPGRATDRRHVPPGVRRDGENAVRLHPGRTQPDHQERLEVHTSRPAHLVRLLLGLRRARVDRVERRGPGVRARRRAQVQRHPGADRGIHQIDMDIEIDKRSIYTRSRYS